MNPVRVTPPVDRVVPLEEMRDHLRVDGAQEDVLIEALQDAAVSHLDGWRGILGRCIMPQGWRVEYGRAGLHRLPFPDVVEMTALDEAGDPVGAELCHDGLGALVDLDAPAIVTITCALPEDALPAVQAAVKLLVGHWYAHREAVGPTSLAQMPLSVQSLIAPLRWVAP